MTERPVIEVENVSKHYRLSGGTRSLKAMALELLRRGRPQCEDASRSG